MRNLFKMKIPPNIFYSGVQVKVATIKLMSKNNDKCRIIV